MAIIDSKGRPVTGPRKSRKPARATPPSDDQERSQLVEIVTAAVKADRKQFGRPDCARVAAAVLPSLNAAQISLLREGAFGDAMARAVLRLEQNQQH
jgi:hypothetical protein